MGKPPPFKKGPTPIREIILEVSQRLQEESARQAEVVLLWKRLVGKKKEVHAKISTLEEGLLTILVDSASSLYELSLEKKALLEKLQKTLGKDSVRDVRFRVGTFSKSAPKEKGP